MVAEKYRKRYLAQIDFKEGEVVVTNWLHQINEQRPYYCREKPLKGTKH